jgi:hypothetical protein
MFRVYDPGCQGPPAGERHLQRHGPERQGLPADRFPGQAPPRAREGHPVHTPHPLPVTHSTLDTWPSITPAINEGCTRSLRISHTSRRAPLQPVSKTQVPCTPYHPSDIAGVLH